MAPTERSLLPDDEYNPDDFSRQERAFLLEHLGQTPRQVFDGKQPEELRRGIDIPAGVNAHAAFILLQRFWEEAQDAEGAELLELIRMNTLKCDEAQKRGEQQTRDFGGIDHAAAGVGLEEGMTLTRKTFMVPLKAKKYAPKGDWLADLAAEEPQAADVNGQELTGRSEDQGDPLPATAEAVNVLTATCPFCYKPFTHPTDPLKAVHMHVQSLAHRTDEDAIAKWPGIRKAMQEKLDAL